MREITEDLHDKVDWLADKILEFLTGSKGYRVQEVTERVPHVLPARVIRPVSHHHDACGKY